MTLFDALWLGIVQGLTEFLPISSSGHLVVFQELFGLRGPLLAFDVALHLGSLAALLLYYHKRLWQIIVSIFQPARAPAGRRLLLMIVVASIPAAVIGVGFEDFFASLFHSLPAVGIHWLLTAALLFGASRLSEGVKSVESVTVSDALLIGLFQALAILPALSRSGATIAAAIMCGLRAREAADFSFLISIPAIMGAGLVQAGNLASVSQSEISVYAFGALISAVVSYAAIWLLIRLLQRRVIRPFAWYCLGAGALMLVVTVIRS
jgi:undecaprenyl-diphosphatase